MDAHELARWTRFAAKGGIGKCTAVQDCVAEQAEDLMFLKDDVITVLMQIPEMDGIYLGYCEGVVGRFDGSDVQFHSKLKKPVMTKRSSLTTPKPNATKSSSPIVAVDSPSGSEGGLSKAGVVRSPSPSGTGWPGYTSRSSLPLSRSQSLSRNTTADGPFLRSPSTSSATDSALVTPIHQTPQIDYPRKDNDATAHHITATISSHSPPPSDAEPVEPFSREAKDSHRRPPTLDPPEPSPSTSSFPALEDKSYDAARVSIGSDGEVGIGLSLLQDLVNGVDGWSSPSSGHSSLRDSPVQDPTNRSSSASPDSTAEGYPRSLPSTAPLSINTRARANSRTAPSPSSTQRSQSTTGEDWEGAIYDDYRYSRYSAASKMSNYSQATPSSPSSIPPPMPYHSRTSTDRTMSMDSRYSFQTQSSQRSVAARAAASPLPFKQEPSALDLLALRAKERPPPLNLHTSPVRHSSPLLSPASPAPLTSSSGAFSPSSAGPASALRQRLEDERTAPIAESWQRKGSGRGRGIVVEEDESALNLLSEMTRTASPQPISPQASVPTGLHQNGSPSSYLTDASRDVTRSPTSQSSRSTSPSSPQQPRSRPLPSKLRKPPGGWNEAPSRASLFLPHPGSPRAPTTPVGPLYTRPLSARPQPNPNPPPNSAVTTIRRAVAGGSRLYGPGLQPTIYGRCDVNLGDSMGPVPITFSADPLASPIASRFVGTSPLNIPKRSTTISPMSPSPSKTEFPVDSTGGVIPRPNFIPQAPGTRPRSRSFSGFTSLSSDGSSFLDRGSGEPLRVPSSIGSTNVASESNPSLQSSSPSQLLTLSKSIALPTPHAPSPLSLPHNNNTSSRSSSFKSPTSPLATSSISSPATSPLLIPSTSLSARRPNKLRKVASTTAINLEKVSSPLATARPQFPRHTASGDDLSPTSPSFQFPPRQAHLLQDAASARGSFDTNPHSSGYSWSRVTSPPPTSGRSSPLPNQVSRGPSLRSKLSLPALRIKSSGGTARNDEATGMSSNGKDLAGDLETVQVQDMDFELIRPIIPMAAAGRDSEDSVFTLPEFAPLNPDLGLLRVDSPSVSISSGPSSTLRSPSAFSDPSSPLRTPTSDSDSTTMEAHRQRELKWMALMPTVPASQMRKNKKVRRLLLEGVPSSVRYLVWCRLSDSKAREMSGVYSQLSKRDRVFVFDDIVADASECFPEQPQLHGEEGPLVSLLQAYLTMVPDIQYSTGLACIAGHLLLLSPEEDAFWIFVSMMDTHLRPYFSSSAIQMEVDAALFSKAVESNDSAICRKLYVDMGIAPAAVCRRWFASLFSGSLPVEYLHRVWDIFLYEGIPFLFRVGLALICCNRRKILESTREESVFDILFRPPRTSLPPTTETFISLVFSMKLKDDDIRKQRVKMEAQVKRQTQGRPRALSTLGPARPSTTISLPRN